MKNMTANWMEIAKVLQGGNLVVQLSQGDVASKEVLYTINQNLNAVIKDMGNDI